MSVVLTYPAAGIDAPRLHDELLRAALAPEAVRADVAVAPLADPGPSGPFETRTAVVVLTLPDGTVEADVDAVVAAHVPQARYDPATLRAARAAPLAADRRRADLTRLRRRVAAAGTVADLAPAVLGVLDYLEKEATA